MFALITIVIYFNVHTKLNFKAFLYYEKAIPIVIKFKKAEKTNYGNSTTIIDDLLFNFSLLLLLSFLSRKIFLIVKITHIVEGHYIMMFD